MQDLGMLKYEITTYTDLKLQKTGMMTQLAIAEQTSRLADAQEKTAERLDGILTEMKEGRLQQQGARNEKLGPGQNLYGPA